MRRSKRQTANTKRQTLNGYAFDVVSVALNPAIDHTITVSNFTAGAVNRVEQERLTPGGKGVNVAAALADYGCQVALTGFLGRDNDALFQTLFAQKKIQDRFVRIDGRTRVGIKIADPVQQQTTDINFPGLAPTHADLDAVQAELAALNSKWFVVTGSLPPGVETTVYRDIVLGLKKRGCNVVLDTSGEALSNAINAAPNIIKPNNFELAVLAGRPFQTEAETIDMAKQLLAKGIELVAVSLGKDGACFVTNESVVIARPTEVTVKSTVGAGDAMVAGIVAAQLKQLSLAACARLATAFSLDKLTRIESGISPASIERFMDKVTITQIT